MIRKYILITLLLLTIGSTILFSCKQNNKGGDKVYKIGYMICNEETETKERFLPLTNYLTEQTGYKFEMYAVNTQDFTTEYDNKPFDFTHTNSYLFYLLRKTKGTKYLCTEKSGAYGSRTKGVLFTLKTSGVNNYQNIKGKKVLFGPVFAPYAFISQYNLLVQNGINPESDIVYAIPWGAYKHEKVVYGVLFKEYEVGGVSTLDLEQMSKNGKLNIDDINIIGEGPLLPYCTFGYAKDTPQDVVKAVQDALLKLTADDTASVANERLAVLKRAMVDGYEQVDEKEYDIFDAYAKTAKLAPYEDF